MDVDDVVCGSNDSPDMLQEHGARHHRPGWRIKNSSNGFARQDSSLSPASPYGEEVHLESPRAASLPFRRRRARRRTPRAGEQLAEGIRFDEIVGRLRRAALNRSSTCRAR